jgi:hypothetical protein
MSRSNAQASVRLTPAKGVTAKRRGLAEPYRAAEKPRLCSRDAAPGSPSGECFKRRRKRTREEKGALSPLGPTRADEDKTKGSCPWEGPAHRGRDLWGTPFSSLPFAARSRAALPPWSRTPTPRAVSTHPARLGPAIHSRFDPYRVKRTTVPYVFAEPH